MVIATRTPRWRRGRRGRGFSLIELVVALSILGLVGFITAISVSNVLSRNEDRRAEANAQLVALAQQRFSQRYGGYTGYPADLSGIKDVTVISGESRNPDEVSITVGVNGSVGMAVRKDAATCLLYTLGGPGTGLRGLTRADATSSELCIGASGLPATEAEATDAQTTRVW